MKKLFYLFVLLGISNINKAQVTIDLESGLATFGYNDVRIAGNNGTFFSLSDEFNNEPVIFYRARLQYNINKRHSISALYAPLTIKGSGINTRDILFQDVLFPAGNTISTSWKFNSYRFTYQYNLIVKEKFLFALGLTGKVRDAAIRLSTSDFSSEKTNVGVVPLVRFYADWEFAKKLHLIVDGDALVGRQGRAEDILLALQYQIIKPLRVKVGYRMLEGGADNDEVYNFSSVHYGVIGATFIF